MDGEAEVLPEDSQLLDGRWPVHVGGDEEGPEALSLEVPAELRDRGRLAGPLEAEDHDDRGRPRRHGEAVRRPADQRHELLVDDLDDLLPGSDALEDLLAHRALAHPLDEGAGDLEVDVALQEGHANLAERLLDVLLGEATGSPEAVEDGF